MYLICTKYNHAHICLARRHLYRYFVEVVTVQTLHESTLRLNFKRPLLPHIIKKLDETSTTNDYI